MSRLEAWRDALRARLTAEGRSPWTAAPKDHPYIEYHPTITPRHHYTREGRATPAPMSAADLRRAIKRAYEHEVLVPWAPAWMIAALFPERDAPDLPRHLTGLAPLVTKHRYADPSEHTSLDAIARLSGTQGVLAFIRQRSLGYG